ncbi:MAG: 50S ribosomal protein L25 [Omnitrophica bacterium]|nr:50S ribosomal protein L25 [Candidatus Omnitrophota bacterium]
MEKVVLNAEIREEKGTIKAKKLRKKRMIPAVVYKDGKEAISLKLKQDDLYDVLHTTAGENALMTLVIAGEKKTKNRTCIIKEVQRDAVKDDIIHVDLKEISLTEKIKVKIPIRPHGEAEGVVKDEGVLDHVLWEIEVECLPADIPEKISVEVSAMKIGDTVYVKDLKLPANVGVLNDPDLTVLSVVPPAKEEVAEEALAEEGAEPEVIAKGKKEEEEIPEGEGDKPTKPAKEDTPPKDGAKK